MKPTSVLDYLDTILRTDERVIATNIGLKTSNVLCNVYYVSYSIIKRLADGCPCMLVP